MLEVATFQTQEAQHVSPNLSGNSGQHEPAWALQPDS